MVVPMKSLDDRLLQKVARLAECYRRKVHLPRSESEDLQQSLTAHLLEQSGKYRPELGDYEAFAATVVRRKAMSLMRARYAQCRDARRTRSLNRSVDTGDRRPTELGKRLLTTAHTNRLGERALSDEVHCDLVLDMHSVAPCLTDRQRQICALLMRVDVAKTARTLGISRDAVYQEMRAIATVFEQAGLDRYVQLQRPTLSIAAA